MVDGKKKNTKEGQEIFDLKPLTEKEIAYFMDFAREQYLVRQDDIREAFAVLEGTIEIVEER